jgi:hypothetical protein
MMPVSTLQFLCILLIINYGQSGRIMYETLTVFGALNSSREDPTSHGFLQMARFDPRAKIIAHPCIYGIRDLVSKRWERRFTFFTKIKGE